jgi:hypothetical protein
MKLKGSMSHLRWNRYRICKRLFFIDTIDNGFKVKITREAAHEKAQGT